MEEATIETPLAGLRVVELGGSVAGPYGTWILARLGATVLKVERPKTGDDSRAWAAAWYNGFSAMFAALNAGKHSVVVDLADSKQRAVIRKYIIENADVVVQNMRPGAAEAMGLGGDELLAENKRLIYCNSGAFGLNGPLSSLPGYDPLMQAFSGIMSVTGEPGRPPVRVGTSIVDMGVGMWCAIGVLVALQNRIRTGKGGRVDTSLYETALGWMTYHAAAYFGEGKIAARQGSSTTNVVPYQAYACADGHLVIAAPNDRMFAKLADLLGHPEWSTDPRFENNPKRLDNRDALNAMIESITATKPKAHWQEVLTKAGLANSPLHSIDEVIAHPQTRATGMIQETSDGLFKFMGLPLSFDGVRPPQNNGPPELGLHDAIVFPDRVRD